MAEVPEQYKNNLMTLSKMKQFHSDGQFWDVQLQVDNRLFKCQRSVLAANSEYFYTMFRSEFEESNATKDQPIILHQMDGTAFEEMLHFMYTGEIRVNDSNVLQLLFMSDFLRLRTGYVKEECLRHVKNRSRKSLPMSNALDLLSFACLTGENVLVDTLRAHICRHLYHYSKDAQLVEISFEILNTILEFSKDCVLPLHGSANVLLMIVHNWIKHNREARSQYYSNLMKNVDAAANFSSNYTLSLMNRLRNEVDEDINLSQDIESSSKLKMVVTGIDTNLAYGDAQFDEMISFNFKNVSKNTTVYSSSVIISDLSWMIGIGRRGENLGMYLYCNGTSLTSPWYCYASAIFTVVSHKEGRKNFVRRMERNLFSSYYNLYHKMPFGWGPRSFLKWKDLKNPEYGFIKEDDSVTLNVHVFADVPFLKFI